MNLLHRIRRALRPDVLRLYDGTPARLGLRVLIWAPLHPEAHRPQYSAVHEITGLYRDGTMVSVGPCQFHASQLVKAPRSRRDEPVFYPRRQSNGEPAAWLGGRCPTHLHPDCDDCAAPAVRLVQDVNGPKYRLGVSACELHAEGRDFLRGRPGNGRCWFCHRDGRAPRTKEKDASTC